MVMLFDKYFNEYLPKELPHGIKVFWRSSLMERYYSNTRRCHRMEHLNECLEHFETAKSFLKNPEAVCLAILFRYFEYDPKLADCGEVNINRFRHFSEQTKLNMDKTLCEDVISLLKVAATNSTDEHKIEGCFGCEDKHYFLDIDMAILGMGTDDYEMYTKNVREEYDFLDDRTYKELRLKVLESFIQIPNIYATQLFRDKYESVARYNILKEIDILKSESM